MLRRQHQHATCRYEAPSLDSSTLLPTDSDSRVESDHSHGTPDTSDDGDSDDSSESSSTSASVSDDAWEVGSEVKVVRNTSIGEHARYNNSVGSLVSFRTGTIGKSRTTAEGAVVRFDDGGKLWFPVRCLAAAEGLRCDGDAG